MFKTIFLFEFRYRGKRAATFVYAGIVFLLCFLGVISPNIKLGSPLGQIYANAPYIIYRMTLVASFGLMIVNAAIMGVAVVRDADHRMEPLLFSTRLPKWSYLMGRFWGSFTVLVLIHIMFPLGFICGFLVGNAVPWELSWRGQELLPFDPWIYLHSFFFILVPNLFITSSLFFMAATLGRKAIIIYSQGIFFLIFYQVVYGVLKGMDEQALAALIDPLGVQTFTYVTRYWTIAEQNIAFLPFNGMMLYNRLLWVAIGFLLLVITYYRFSFMLPEHSGKGSTDSSPQSLLNLQTARTEISPLFTTRTYVKQFGDLTFFYARTIRNEIPFIAIAGSGVVLFFLNAIAMNAGYGNSQYPTTSALLGLLNNSFGIFFLIIAVYYSGELVWKERSVYIHALSDALPVSSQTRLLAKFTGLHFVYAMMLLVLIGCCVIIQLAKGYYVFEWSVYFGTLYAALFVDLFLYTAVFIFIQVIVNNKFLGFSLCIAFVIINALLEQVGLKHDLWKYASGTLGMYSMMNAYRDLIIPFVWFKSYWLALSGVLLVIAIVFYVRGTDTSIPSRWKTGKRRITPSLVVFTLTMAGVFLVCGGFIYTSTTSASSASPDHPALSERKYDQDECAALPILTSIQLTLELYPSQRRFEASGVYMLANKSGNAIRYIPVRHSTDDRLRIGMLKFDHKVKEEFAKDTRYIIYELEQPLAPGDSLQMDFHLSFQSGKFDDQQLTPGVIHNGSFIDHSYFPLVSYEQKPEGPMKESKSAGERCGHVQDGNGGLVVDALIGTEPNQTVVGPGLLRRKWEKSGRSYFHYKTGKVVRASYFFASARYERVLERWNNIDLEIYYHPSHTYNLGAMIKGMKDGLAYCSKNFGPYPFQRLCIAELPFYSTPPDSYRELIPFSENKEFIYRHRDSLEVDRAYEQTVRQVANQWWRHGVVPSNVNESRLLADGLSAYTTLMVLKHAYGSTVFDRYVSDLSDRYLKARNIGEQREQSLERATGQPHVQQYKAAIAFYALQDYVGEEKLNTALRAYASLVRPTGSELVAELRHAVPDTLHTFYDDLFQSVTLFENTTRDVVYRENRKNEFEVLLSLSCEKIRVDSHGKEERMPVDDWIDIGIYAKGKSGRDTLIYLQKHRIADKDNLITVTVRTKPLSAGIDPLHKLIDVHPLDNVHAASTLVEIQNLGVEF